MMRWYHGLHVIRRTGKDHISMSSLLPLFQDRAHPVHTMDKMKKVTAFINPRQTPHGAMGWSVVCDCGIFWPYSLFVE